jgi:hypothetical protein
VGAVGGKENEAIDASEGDICGFSFSCLEKSRYLTVGD